MRTLLFSSLLSLFAFAAPADTLHVPGDHATIAAALAAAQAGDVVLVACGSYAEAQLELRSGVTLRGAGAACTTIDAGAAGGVLRADGVGDALVEGLTLRNGLSSAGAGLRAVDSLLQFRDVHFVANRAAEDSGFQLSGGSARFDDCVFEDNGPSIGGGGGLFQASAEFHGCRFEGNESFESGGAIEIWTGSQALFADCSFLGNQALWGGAVYVHFDALVSTLRGCELRDNVASADGGGVFVSGNSELRLEYGVVADNQPEQGFVAEGGTVRLFCVDTDPAQWAGSGLLEVENDDCPVATRRLSFGQLRALNSPR